MPWLFGRRGKAAKLKGPPSAAPPRRTPSQRSRRRNPSKQDHGHDYDHDQDHEKAPLPVRSVLPQSSAEDITALPVQRRLAHSPHLRPVSQTQGTIPYNFHLHSHSSLPAASASASSGAPYHRGKLQRPRSLRKDHPSESLIRRRSSRRTKEHDQIREEEIRTMSLPMPQKRPAGSSGGMLRRDSKKVKGGLNSRFERQTSNISLPLQDSIHSSMSGNSDRRAFRVSALDMFSPRPTIRCSTGSQYYAMDRSSPTAQPSRTESRRERRPNSSSRDDKHYKRTSRIDDLADELDAPALREILERDKRRREKKAKADQERLRRRLERRAEKQHAADISGTPATPRKNATGVVGLGIEKGMPSPMEDVRPSTPPQPHRADIAPVTPQSQSHAQLPTPLDSPTEEVVVSDARAIRYSRGSVSGPAHARGTSNVSELPELISEKLASDASLQTSNQNEDPFRSGSLHPVDTVESTPVSRFGSTRRRSSEGRRMGVFASLFRRSKRNSQDQGRTTPSEISFSNTSRESMSRQPLPAHLVGTVPATPPVQIRRPSSVPRRTMSKFREDLPEYPLSPPDSRVQSPEAYPSSALAARRRSQAPADLRVESLTSQSGTRSDSPVSPNLPAGNIMSQSLASVDSEGSWLSGKPIKRASNRSHLRSSVGSSAVQKNEAFNASYEELGMADDEYFQRLTSRPDDRSRSTHSGDALARKASSTLMALDAAVESEEEQGQEVPQEATPSGHHELVHNVVERQPTIVHRQGRVKSTEGLLSFYSNDKSEDQSSKMVNSDPETPDSPTFEPEPVMVQRAKSVELGKHHVRHLSAGSAKLLDIPKRSSTPMSQQRMPS